MPTHTTTATTDAAAPPPSSPYRHLVFVYGTLKRGENNYPYWMADPCNAFFLGTARTRHRYPFFINLLPDFPGSSPNLLNRPVLREPGGDGWEARAQHVEGELYLVTEPMLRWLDILEDTSEGLYTALPVEVDHVRPPPSLLRTASLRDIEGGTEVQAQPRTLYELLSAPFRREQASWAGVEALVYFRSRGFPSDWASPTPRSSTRLLATFSAAGVLAQYGARFAGGVPAHHRSPEAARYFQARMDALPPALQPPMATARQRQRLAEAAPATQGSAWTDAYASAVDVALLQPPPNGPGPAVLPSDDDNAFFVYGAPLLPKPMVLFIVDGVGDSTYAELGHRTPLEVVAGATPRRQDTTTTTAAAVAGVPEARVTLDLGRFLPKEVDPASLRATENVYEEPGINTVARDGVSGLMDPFLAGRSCGSDTAHLSFFGYNPEQYYRGRGAYETLGTAVESSEDDEDEDGHETREKSTGREREEEEEEGGLCLSDLASDAAIAAEKIAGYRKVRFALDDEDVCFKSNFASFADPDEDGDGNEDAALKQRGTGNARETAAAGDSTDGQPFNTPRNYFITHRRCDRDFTREGPVLCRYLNNLVIDRDVHGQPFEYPHVLKIKYATEHRCGVALSGAKTVEVDDTDDDDDVSPTKKVKAEAAAGGGGSRRRTVVLGVLSDKITGTDCLKDGLLLRKCVPTVREADDPAEYVRAVYTCRLVEAASEKITHYLKRHAINEARRQHNRTVTDGGVRKNVANVILFRGAAKKGWVPTFNNLHGLKGFLVAPTCIIKGLGVCCGLDCKPVCPVCFPSKSRALRRALRRKATEQTGNEEEAGRQSRADLLALWEALAPVNRSNNALAGATGDYHSDLAVKVAAALHALRLRCPHGTTHHADRVRAILAAQQQLLLQQASSSSPSSPEGATAKAAPAKGAVPAVVTGQLDSENFSTPAGSAASTSALALSAHPHYNFLVLHVKGVDDAGHDGNPHQKLAMIGACGRALAALYAALPDGATVAVIADHSTPLFVGDHCCEPVPVSVATKRLPRCAGAGHTAEAPPPDTLAGEVAAFRARWRQAQQTQEPQREAAVSFLGRDFASVGELLLCLLEERTAAPLSDAVIRYTELAPSNDGALGRFRGEELIGIMKRMHAHYHYM